MGVGFAVGLSEEEVEELVDPDGEVENIPALRDEVLARVRTDGDVMDTNANLIFDGGNLIMGNGAEIVAELGTAANPSIQLGDENTGVWSAGNNRLNFSAGGQGQMEIDGVGAPSITYTFGTTTILFQDGAGDGVIQTINETGSDWVNRQVGNFGSAYAYKQKGLGTIAAPLPLTAGAKIGGEGYAAYDGTTWRLVSAEISAYVTEDVDTDSHGTELRLKTTRNGETAQRDVALLREDGTLTLPEYGSRAGGQIARSRVLGVDAVGNVVLGAPRTIMPFLFGGRTYLETNRRWIASSDDNYSVFTENHSENAGTGTNPVHEWEHQGVPLRAGETLLSFDLRGTTNSNEPGDLEIALYFRRPSFASRWESGIDNDGEMLAQEIFRTRWMNPPDAALWGSAFSGSLNDMHRRRAILNFTAPGDGWLAFYIRPTSAPNSRRFFRHTCRADVLSADDYG